MQILQRRLASSPAAIYQSLKRRRERLENELGEARLAAKGRRAGASEPAINADMLRNIEEYGQEEIDELEDLISTGATTAETVEQLALEVETLKGLEAMALEVLRSGVDTKWSQLNRILDDDLMIDAAGNRRKLIIFTEPKDTLHYLLDKVRARLGNPEAVEVIHGGVSREERRKVVERFMQDKDMLVLIANDAAGEGVNLQRGHLMVNYDLPWNPNKIEQRFGRIHRIGQTEVCHLWNLVAADTREGEVYARPIVGPMVFFAEAGTQWLAHVVSGWIGLDDAPHLGQVTQGETLCFGAVARPQRVLKGSGELILVKLQRLVDTT